MFLKYVYGDINLAFSYNVKAYVYAFSSRNRRQIGWKFKLYTNTKKKEYNGVKTWFFLCLFVYATWLLWLRRNTEHEILTLETTFSRRPTYCLPSHTIGPVKRNRISVFPRKYSLIQNSTACVVIVDTIIICVKNCLVRPEVYSSEGGCSIVSNKSLPKIDLITWIL